MVGIFGDDVMYGDYYIILDQVGGGSYKTYITMRD